MTRAVGAFRLERHVGSPNTTGRLLASPHPATVTETCTWSSGTQTVTPPARAPLPQPQDPALKTVGPPPLPPFAPPPPLFPFLVLVAIADVLPVPPRARCQCHPCKGRAPTPAHAGDLGGHVPCTPQVGLACLPPQLPPLSSGGTVRPQPWPPKPPVRSHPSQRVCRVAGTTRVS